MKRYSLSIALLALTAFLAFLSACGEGEPVNLSDRSDVWTPIGIALQDIERNINACKEHFDEAQCYSYGLYAPSSTEPPESIESSSSQSSSSQSSSSQYEPPVPPSSSSEHKQQIEGINCDDPTIKATIQGYFTCSWNGDKPNEVESGNQATLIVQKNTGAPANCAIGPEAYIEISQGYDEGTAWINVGEALATSGLYPKVKEADFFTAANKSWPKSGTVVANGILSCPWNDGVTYACPKECSALSITPAPAPISDVKLACAGWDAAAAGIVPVTPGYKGNLSINTSLNACSYTGDISNNASAKCGAAYGKKDISIKYCDKINGDTPASCNVGSAKDITAYVIADCKGGQYTLDSLKYKVVPNANLTGSCAWDTKNNTFGGGVTAKVTSASTATINDSYGRCDAAPSFFVNNTKKSLVSAGLVVDDWGGGSNQTMTGITIGVACGATNANTINCPDITVKDPSAMCEYQASWCNGIALNKIKTEDVSDPPIGQAGESPGACFFATTVDKIANVEESKFKVNGINGTTIKKCGNTEWSQPTCATALSSVDKADNGYYIYVDGSLWTAQEFRLSNSYKPKLHPNCEAQK